ncbi:DUF4175 domain-containing protein [Magnetospira sp. QH-2]|uniref:DUF4175 domain-containing protein n=1 Tax=Magnetospira sp. (strain QH-2) TaxID=1288970 RepID=UPI0003E8143C|nr:DUF4175 family protein [Magnetospira sp. QH-2]CCQ74741.1 conserved membrane protein of unknown function [Magnetospira sp. QH-2]
MTTRRETRLNRLLPLARAGLAWEILWPRLWIPIGLLYLFFAIALTDWLPLLPGWLHGLLLASFAVGFLLTLIRAVITAPAVTEAEVARRLETDSALVHHPLTTLRDKPVNPNQRDSRTDALWRAHVSRAAQTLDRLRWTPPRPEVAKLDPWALRTVPLLLLVAAIATAWGDIPPRLGRALTPVAASDSFPLAQLDMWITPPDYTGVPPLHRDQAGLGPVRVPVRSRLLLQVSGSDADLVLRQGDQDTPLSDLGDGSRRVEVVLDRGNDIQLLAGADPVAAWPLSLIPDLAPDLAFAEAPEGNSLGLLKVAYSGRDDYGIVAMDLVINLPATTIAAQRIALAPPSERRPIGRLNHDMARHAWAGQKAALRLWARDAAGNETVTEPVLTSLPTRVFSHPVATELARLRSRLASDKQSRVYGALSLNRLKRNPDAFDHDIVVYLGLATAQTRLLENNDPAVIGVLRDLFWDLALRLEEGNMGLARRDLEKARQDLLEALRDGVDKGDLAALAQSLREAMERMMRAMEKALSDVPPDLQPLMEATRVVTGDDLERMLDKLAQLMREGNFEEAMDLLGELGQITNALQEAGKGGMDPEALRAAQEILDDLRALESEQQQVMDETFRTVPPQTPMDPKVPRAKRKMDADERARLQSLAERQQDLAGRLTKTRGKLAKLLGDVPLDLTKAGLAMSRAERALESQRARSALPRQSEALDGLRKGLDQMLQDLSKAAGGGKGRMPMMGRGQGQDPFGRRGGSPMGEAQTGPIGIPKEGVAERATKIRREIQRRANEDQRSNEERRYLRRLLERE